MAKDLEVKDTGPYLCTMYDQEKYDRVEAWPLKGTKEKLKELAQKKGKTTAKFVAELLERRAGIKKT